MLADAVIAYRAGDHRALATLMTLCDAQMRRVARRHVNCAQDAEDAAQTAWLAFARSVDTIVVPGSVGSWLCVTTARAAMTIARKKVPVRPVGSEPPEPPTADDEDVIDLDERRAAVRDAVGRLEEADRELVWLLFDKELTYEEISERTGRAVGGIGPTRARVIAKLRRDRAIRRCAPERTA